MKHKLISALIIAVFGVFAYRAVTVEVVPAEPVAQSTPQGLPLTRENLLMLVNEERAKVGVAPLVVHEMLNQSAQWKANDMKQFDYRSHIKPGEVDNNGITYIAQLNKGINVCNEASENLAWTANKKELTADAAIDWWKDSEAHYEAMIDPNYIYTGFGITKDIAVQHFCTPI